MGDACLSWVFLCQCTHEKQAATKHANIRRNSGCFDLKIAALMEVMFRGKSPNSPSLKP